MKSLTMARSGTVAWIAASWIAVVAVGLGASPLVTTLVVGATWVASLSRIVSFAPAMAVVVLGWMALTFIGHIGAPFIPWAPTSTVAALLAATTFGTLPLARVPRIARVGLSIPVIAASLFGAFIWIVAVCIGLFSPRGSGVSWAVYMDASLDIRAMRTIAAAGGLDLTAFANPRPLEHVLSSAMLPSTHRSDGSHSDWVLEVYAHAVAVGLLVALSCVLGSLVTAELLRSVGARRWVQATGAVVTSVILLSMPATGAALYRGQLNVHVIWAIGFSSFLLAMRSRAFPAHTLAALVSATTLAMLCWTPFAALPAALAVLVTALNWRPILAASRLAKYFVGASVAAFLWCFVVFASSDFIRLSGAGGSGREDAVTVPTVYPNPASVSLFAGMATLVIVLAWMLSAAEVTTRLTMGAAAAALVLGAVPLFAARGSLSGALEYYPARYVHMATVLLLPLCLGAGLALLSRHPAWKGLVAVAGIATVTIVAVAAPLRPPLTRWGFVPLSVVSGAVYGRHDQMGDKVLDYGRPEEYRVAWHADPQFDWDANWTIASFDPVPSAPYGADGQWVLRAGERSQPIADACALAEETSRPVVLITRRTTLAEELQRACPDAQIRVELLTR